MDAAIGATQVGELSGVLFHVRALNFHAPLGAVIEDDVKVAVVGNRLIVLGNLVVLRLIRVEVILAGKARRLRNLAVQRQTDLDGAFHALRIHYGQGSR